jgi:hypothetical protein
MSSKPGSFMRLIGALSAGALLAACMTEQATPAQGGHGPMMGGHAGEATASGAPPAAARPDGADMRRMCRMQQDMQHASPAERQAMMEQHMKDMSPDMRRHQMEMMQQHCQ